MPNPIGIQPGRTGIPAAALSPLGPTSRVPQTAWVAPVVASIASDAQRGVAARGFALPANAKTEQWLFAYHTGKAKEMNLTSAPPNNKLQLTIAMHISGHTGQADQFAQDPNESFTLTVRAPDGTSKSEVVKMGGAPGAPVYAKAHDIEIDVSKPGNYTVDITPSATSVGGYIEGRRYNLHVGKENFFKPEQPPAGYQPAAGATYPYPIDEMASLAHAIR